MRLPPWGGRQALRRSGSCVPFRGVSRGSCLSAVCVIRQEKACKEWEMGAPVVDHVAVKVADLEAAVEFFAQVMGMEITLTDPADGTQPLRQVWVGGIQLQRGGAGKYSGDVSHIGLVAERRDELLDAVYAHPGVVQAEGKPRNWFVAPFGLTIEVNECE